MEREFIYDIVLESKDICNMKKDFDVLKDACESGKRMVLYGLRNAGKTSLVKSLLIPWFRKTQKNAVCIYVDFMGVDSLEDIAMRLRSGFERAYTQAFPLKGSARLLLEGFFALRPILSSSGGDNVELTITGRAGEAPRLEEIIAELGHLSKKASVLLVFDEFQDVAAVPKAEALFRGALQSIPHRVPVVVMGSKKHLLANIFSKPKAPFHNWGEDLEIGPLPYNEYCTYMNERFERFGLSISPAVSKTLQDTLHRNPEAINMVCRGLVESYCGKRKNIDESLIEPTVVRVVEKRGRRYEELFSRFSPSEQKFLITLSKRPGVRQPQGKDFVAALGVSAAAVRKALHYLEDEAIIDKTDNGYRVSDPLLACYLKHFR
jgi:hypothetical protein